MATKPKKADNAEDSSLENDLIQGAQARDGANASSGNPAHEEGGSTTGSEPDPAADLPEWVEEGAKDTTMQLPAMVKPEEKKLPLMVDESQVIGEEDLRRASSGNPVEGAPMFQGDPTDKTADELHQSRLAKYGKDYVVTKKGKRQQVWPRHSWEAIRGDKGGWVEAAMVPDEVRALRAKK